MAQFVQIFTQEDNVNLNLNNLFYKYVVLVNICINVKLTEDIIRKLNDNKFSSSSNIHTIIFKRGLESDF